MEKTSVQNLQMNFCANKMKKKLQNISKLEKKKKFKKPTAYKVLDLKYNDLNDLKRSKCQY